MKLTCSVSVIMPSFNSEAFIEDSINSVINQIFTDWELLIIDGGSTDATLQLVANKIKSNPQLKISIISNRKDRGPAHARSLGIYNAVGDYIAFLDADDIWDNRKLHLQIDQMKNLNHNFSYTLYHKIHSSGAALSGPLKVKKSYTYRKYLRQRGIGNSTVVVKRELFDDEILNTVTKYAEDTLWWLLIMKKNNTAFLCNFDLMAYRISPNGLSRNTFKNLKMVFLMYIKYLNISYFNTSLIFLLYGIDVSTRRLRLLVSSFLNGKFL
jgi:teichuronic acid biosynthesis glycosyltransferase TuaG